MCLSLWFVRSFLFVCWTDWMWRKPRGNHAAHQHIIFKFVCHIYSNWSKWAKLFSFLSVTSPSTCPHILSLFCPLSSLPLFVPTCFPPLLPLPSCLCIRVGNILFMAPYWQRHSWSGSACGPAAPALFMPLSWLGSRALEQMAAVFNWTLPLYPIVIGTWNQVLH